MNIHRVLILSLGLVISFCTAAEITRGPYLQLAREDGITLVWRTDKATPTRMWVVGDSGTGEYHQLLVHRAMQIYTKETKRPLDFYLHVGDMAYGQGTDDQFQKKFFEPYDKTLRNKVCWASLGNHEGSSSDGKKTKGLFSMRLSARPKAKPAASHPAASLSTRSIMAISM